MILRTCFFVLLIGAVGMSGHAQKCGHIDKQQVLLQMAERPSVEARIRAKAQELEQRIAAMQTELQEQIAKAQEDVANMTETEKAMAQRDLEGLAQRIDDARTQAGADLEKLQEELISPLLARIDAAIAEVAAAEGYAYVFDAGSGVLLYAGGTDLTLLVKAKLEPKTP
jgi:outer membrane protein